MVAERKGVSRLNLRISTPEGVPLPFYRKGGTRRFRTKSIFRKYEPDTLDERSVKTD